MSLPFRSKTTGYLIEAIDDGYTNTKMGTLFLKAGADPWEPASYANKAERVQGLLRLLQVETTPAAFAAAQELVRLVLVHGKPNGYRNAADWWEPLKTALAADGWAFDEHTDTLVPLVPGVHVAIEATWIVTELRHRGWLVPAGHYDQAVESFAEGRWAAANGQLRSFFESLVRTAGGTDTQPGSGQVLAAFDRLDAAGSLLPDEAEFGKRTWKLLHSAGSHPGLSDEDESRFRLLALTGYARFLLTRLP
jgi:hypothetical protein